MEERSILMKSILLIGVCLGVFTVVYNTTSVLNALPSIVTALKLTSGQTEWSINAYLLSAASLIIVGGRLADIFCVRFIYYLGIIGFLIGSICVALAGSNLLFLIGRIIQGLCVALVTPNSLTIIKLNFTNPERQKMAVGIWSGVVSLGMSAGPIISGIVIHFVSWRYVFWLNLPLCISALMICWLVPRVKEAKKIVKIDYIGQILLIISTFLLAFALTESTSWGWENSWLWVILVISGIGYSLFYFVERRVVEPTVDISLLHNLAFTGTLVLMSIIFFILIGILYAYNLTIQNPSLFAYDPIRAGLSLLPLTGAIFILSLFMPKLCIKYGYRFPSVISFALVAIGFVLFYFIKADANYNYIWLPLLLIGLGLGGTFPCLPGFALSSLEAKKAAMGSSVLTFCMYVASIFGTAFCGLIYAGTIRRVIYDKFQHFGGINKHTAQAVAEHIIRDKPITGIIKHMPQHFHPGALFSASHSVMSAFNYTSLLLLMMAAIAVVVSFISLRKPKNIAFSK